MSADDDRRRRKKKKKSRRDRSRDALGSNDDDEEAQPLPVERGEAEFANASAINADNEPVVAVVGDGDRDALVQQDHDDEEEDLVPAPIAELDMNVGGIVVDGNDMTEGGELFTSDGLAVATAIDANDEDDYIYAAIEYDPDSKPPLHKNRRFRVYTCLALMIVAAVCAIVAVYVAKGSKGVEITEKEELWDGDPTTSPTLAPTTDREASGIREQVEAQILQRGANFTDMDPSDPRYQALDWILHYDQLQLDSDDVNLYQRYVLALLAFTFDSLAWYACGEHRKFGNVTENFVTEECRVQNMATGQVEEHSVWLSSTEECDWYGVICSSDEVVRGVELMGNDLIGEIPPEISQLRFLQYLALNGNCLYGTVPHEFGSMPNLLSLELHGNGLSGSLPVEIYDASKLQLLNVAMQFQFSSVCRRSDGRVVNTLYKGGDPYSGEFNNGLSGPVLGQNVSRWSSMKGLHLFDNWFDGWIDDGIGKLKYLVFLRVHNNVFSSWIPDGLTKLKKLREVYLNKNGFVDYLPAYIGEMEDLEDLRVNENEVNGTIPDTLYDLKKLKNLWLQDTLSCEELEGGKLECLADSDKGFEGTISTEIGNLKKLSVLLLNNNPIQGTIPTEIGLCENLAVLHVHKTNLEGSAPRELCLLRDTNLNNENNAGVFYADCRPDNKTQDPFFKCECCTDCCDHTTKVCIADD